MSRFKPKSTVIYFTAVIVVVILLLLCYHIILASSVYQVDLVLERVPVRQLEDRQNVPNSLFQKCRRYLMEYIYRGVEQSKGDKFPPNKNDPSQGLKKFAFSGTFVPLLNDTTRIISKSKLLLSNNRTTRISIHQKVRDPLQQNNPRQSIHTHQECSDITCSEYLSGEDLTRFLNCDGAVRNANATPSNGDCHFINGKGQQPVALASLPGSGNTWVRSLLETATGICTGAVYCDISLRANGFIGEFVRSSSTLVVKTHENAPIWLGSKFSRQLSDHRGRYGLAIFIVRNPFNALVAEWNRKVANNFHPRTISLDSHVKAVGQEWFGDNERWDSYVHSQAERWLTMIDKWVVSSNDHPVLVVKYEKLKMGLFTEVKRILDFLGIDYNRMELKKKIEKNFSLFLRKHNKVNFEHYTRKQTAWINYIITNASILFNKNNVGELIELEDYFYP